MSSRDGIPSLQHTNCPDGLYDDKPGPDSHSAGNKDEIAPGEATVEPGKARAAAETPPPFGMESDHAEMLPILRSVDGSRTVKMMCEFDSLKPLFIHFMNELKNPELRNALRNSIFLDREFSLDTTRASGSKIHRHLSRTPISDLLEANPDSAVLMTNLFLFMQSTDLVQQILNELVWGADDVATDVMSRTLLRMNSNIVIPVLLECRDLGSAQQTLLNKLLTDISKKPSFREIFETRKESSDFIVLPLDGGHSRTSDKILREPENALNPTKAISANLAKDDVGNKNMHKAESFFSARSIAIHVGEIVGAVKDVLSIPATSGLFQVHWFAEALNRAISYIRDTKPADVIHDILSEYKKVRHPAAAPAGLEVTRPKISHSTHSVPSIIEIISDPVNWEIVR
jgi:hypothetical protein